MTRIGPGPYEAVYTTGEWAFDDEHELSAFLEFRYPEREHIDPGFANDRSRGFGRIRWIYYAIDDSRGWFARECKTLFF